jgi:hypothetical protein
MSARTILAKAWPGLKVDLVALGNLAFISVACFSLQSAFGWNADRMLLGWIGFIAAKSHVRLTMMGAP